MQVRIWGPAQEDLVENFRRQVSNEGPAPLNPSRPYYVTLTEGGKTKAFLRVEDCLSDNGYDGCRTARGPELHLTEFRHTRDMDPAQAIALIAPALYELIYCTYRTSNSIRITFGFTDDEKLKDVLSQALDEHAAFAAYKFRYETPRQPVFA